MMRDSIANTSVLDPWTELLRQTSAALSSLRMEDLEELAGRAECMLEATLGDGAVRQRMAAPRRETMEEMARERGLLQSLLIETDRNLKVLQRIQLNGRTGTCGGEVDSRWVR